MLENEIGAVSIDDDLVENAAPESTSNHDDSTSTTTTAAKAAAVERVSGPEVVLMPNGCLCCRTRGDLRDALRRLLQRGAEGNSPLDGIVVELSGASEVRRLCNVVL